MFDAGEQTGHDGGAAVPVPPSPPTAVRLEDGHTVTLHPRAPLALGIAAMSVFRQGGSVAAIEGGLAEVYLRFGIASWDYPEPVTPEAVERLLPFEAGGLEVAEACDALYSEAVVSPLARRLSALSPTGPTGGTTSAAPPPGPTPPTRSSRSSRTTTAGTPSGAPAR